MWDLAYTPVDEFMVFYGIKPSLKHNDSPRFIRFSPEQGSILFYERYFPRQMDKADDEV